MEQSPSWEANRWSASQEVPRSLWNRKFISTFTSARHMPLFWARSIQSMPHLTSWRSILILSSHLCPGLPSGFFTSGLPTNTQGVKIWFWICRKKCLNTKCWAKRLYFALGSWLLLIFFNNKAAFVMRCHEVQGRTFVMSSRKILFGQALYLTLKTTF